MCGRTACTLAPDDVVKACTYKDGNGKRRCPAWKDAPGGQKYWPSQNISPTTHTPVLVSSNFDGVEGQIPSERMVTPMKWGLTPSWHKGDPYKVPYETNNCRAEGMLDKKTYKMPLQKGFRCVVLADGYFEWKTSKDGKQPYFFYFPQPNNIAYPGDTVAVKTDVFTDNKDEKESFHETHLDAALKQEILLEEIKQELKYDIQHNDNAKVKEEFLIDQKHARSSSEPSSKHGIKREHEDSSIKEIKPADSFWDSVKLKTEELELEKTVGKSAPATQCDNKDDTSDNSEWNGQRLLAMAGVYDIWTPPDGSPPLYSYSIITVQASPDVEWCHHRMPAILSTEEEVQDWLDSANIPMEKAALLIKSHSGLMFHPVTRAMNNSRYKSPDCLKPVELGKPKVTASSNMMMNWLKSGSPAKKKKIE